MTKGTEVTWTTTTGVRGSGTIISDESEGHSLVAVDAGSGDEHRVIYCATTWLTAKPKEPTPTPWAPIS